LKNKSKKKGEKAMKLGIFVCGRDINLPLPEWERLMWGEPPNKMGSLPIAVEILFKHGDKGSLVVLGNGCTNKNNVSEIGFTKKYLVSHLCELTKFRRIGREREATCVHLDELINIVEVSRVVNNTAEEIVEAARLFSEAGINRIFMVSCGSQIARATMAQLAAKEAGKIPEGQQWFFVADDMFYSHTTEQDVVVVTRCRGRGAAASNRRPNVPRTIATACAPTKIFQTSLG